MKKMLILVSVVAMSLAACGKKNASTTPAPAEAPAESEAPAEGTETPAEGTETPAEGGEETPAE
jgi:nitrous oxide reductase accessory protein NosL